MAQTLTHIFRVALARRKKVYRDIEIASNASLHDLAAAISQQPSTSTLTTRLVLAARRKRRCCGPNRNTSCSPTWMTWTAMR